MKIECSLWGRNWIFKYYLGEGFINHGICKVSTYILEAHKFSKNPVATSKF